MIALVSSIKLVFQYHRNQTGKKADYYVCSKTPKNGCKGRAVVQRIEKFDEETGRIVTQKRLVAVTKPEVHARVHSSENSAIIACSLVVQMKEEVARNPSMKLGERER